MLKYRHNLGSIIWSDQMDRSKKVRILLLEDDANLNDTICDFLESSGVLSGKRL